MMKQANKNILNVPKLRFPEFRDAGEWKDKLLGDIGKVSMCKRIMKRETSESGYIPFYKIGTFGKKADAYISKELYDLYRKKFSFPKKSDILISASGTIGRTVVYDGKPAYFQDSNIIWIDNDENIVSNLFLAFVYQIVKWMTDNNTIARLYNDNLRKIEITIPSPSEQQKIADCLTSLDDIIAAQNQKLNILKTHKKGLMQNLFPANGKTTPKLRFPEFKDNWQEKKLGDIGNFYRGHNYVSTNVKNDGLLVLRSSNIQNNLLVLNKDLQFVDKNCSDNISLKTNDIVICMANGSKHLVGKSGVYLGNYDKKLTVGAFCSIFRSNNSLSKYLLQTTQYRKYLYIILTGSSINNLKNSELAELKFNIPTSHLEQQKIADCLTSLDEIIAAQTKKLNILKAHKKGLMQQLFP